MAKGVHSRGGYGECGECHSEDAVLYEIDGDELYGEYCLDCAKKIAKIMDQEERKQSKIKNEKNKV